MPRCGWTFLRKLAAHFGQNSDGNVAIIFALATIPLIVFVGASIDYSRANAVKTAMQNALDATGLMLWKEAATDSGSTLQTNATNYFKAQFTRPEATNVLITASYTTTAGTAVILNSSADVPTTFLGVIGINNISVASSNSIKWGSSRLRVALVLDNTGSMSQNSKLSALITATNNLLTQLRNAATTNGDVYVSIIPFVKDVSVDPITNYTASWIDWTGWEAEPQVLDTTKSGSKPSNWAKIGPGSSCPFTSTAYGFSCVASPGGTSTVSTISSSGTYSGDICPSADTGQKITWKNGVRYNGCYTSVSTTASSTGSTAACPSNSNSYVSCSCTGGGSNKKCTWTYYNHVWRATGTTAAPAHSTWNGCLTDRGSWSGPDTNNYDTNVTAPSTSITATLFPAEQYSTCLQSMMPLSYNWSAMTTLVNNMVANGSTNQNIGLVHGWQSLVGGGPFPTPPAMQSGYTYNQVIILLTDGLNTQDRWYGDGSSTATQIDTRQQMTCNNIKAAGIILYTVQVNTGGDPTSTLLQNCASDPSKFFLLTSSTEIVTTFNQIGTNLSNLYVAK